MLSVTLDNVGKKFGKEWIFRGVSLKIDPGTKMVILGGNGSGKSTLLQIISGYITPNAGVVFFEADGKSVPSDIHHRRVAFASPYLQLPEDMTGKELITHVSELKPFIGLRKSDEILEIAGLSHAEHKYIKQYSSGMRQRLKLALAILADTDLLLLDEPASNLDADAIKWYRDLIARTDPERTIVVCSNAISAEYDFCEKQLLIADYK